MLGAGGHSSQPSLQDAIPECLHYVDSYVAHPDDEAEVDQFFSDKKEPPEYQFTDDNSVADFVQNLRSKIKGHYPQASGRVVFDTQDLESN